MEPQLYAAATALIYRNCVCMHVNVRASKTNAPEENDNQHTGHRQADSIRRWNRTSATRTLVLTCPRRPPPHTQSSACWSVLLPPPVPLDGGFWFLEDGNTRARLCCSPHAT